MARYNSSRALPIALVLIIVAVAIAALVSLTRAVFFSGQSASPSKTTTSQDALVSTAADRSVRMTVRGPIVADEDHKSYQITVTPSSRVLTLYSGYLNSQTNQVALGNNIPAYREFVYALNRANLVKGTELSGDANDTRGICATGRLYQFEVLKADTAVTTLWTSTCKGSSGSLDASATQLISLFTNQISNAQLLVSRIGL
jgi:hypothetical protein